MKTLHIIGALVAVLLILLISLGFTIEEITIINNITSSKQAIVLASSYSGFYLAIKAIVLAFGCYLTSLELYDSVRTYNVTSKLKTRIKKAGIKDLASVLVNLKKQQEAESIIETKDYRQPDEEPVLSCKEESINPEFYKDVVFEPVLDKTQEWYVHPVDEAETRYWLDKYPVRTDFPIGEEGGSDYRFTYGDWIIGCPKWIQDNVSTLQKYVDRYGNYTGKQWLRDLPSPIKKLVDLGYLKTII